MSELRLAGNYINKWWNTVLSIATGLPIAGGHLQVVFVPNDGTQKEIEVQPHDENAVIFPGTTWSYPNDKGYPQERQLNTHEHGNFFFYRYATLDLGDRSAESVLEILEKVNAQFIDK